MFKYKIISDVTDECLYNTNDINWADRKLLEFAGYGYSVTLYVRV